MTFIAISILSAVFITMYLYLLRAQTLATEARRLYAEAAQERLEVIYNPAEENLTIRNTGGISVALKYLVERDEDSGQAKITNFTDLLSDTVLSPNETTWTIYSKTNTENELLVITERGNVFRAEEAAQTGLGIGQFVMKLNPTHITISKHSTGQTTLTLISDQAYEGDPVQINIYNCSKNWDCSISQNPVELDPGSQNITIITIQVKGNKGDYSLLIEGIGSGGETEYATLRVTVS